jgi:photosystem II stability/assembly factor-like uncharacterized protein
MCKSKEDLPVRTWLRLSLVLLSILPLAAQQKPAQRDPKTTDAFDPALYQALAWRNIGPFRGGRVTAVAGVPSQPLTFYMGATGGGVWTTEDAGTTWRNVSDGAFKTGSVGAIAVADSDPNVVFVGMGEAPVRGVATSHGDGVYRSTDAGKTWTHVGLPNTRQISKVILHPTNPDLVYVAAQGSPWTPTQDRGIYRTADGGKTWQRIHHVDQTSGASDLSLNPKNPRELYAAYWDLQRTPWQVRSGGPGSGIYKTTDGGDTWTKLGDGLPKGIMGKIGVAVSPAKPDRVWAMIEADDGGLFRSDDGGKNWSRVNDERILRARAWYYLHVIADPQDENTVYVLNAPFMKSIDAGRTFQTVNAPHGDNHALWINPRHAAYMINGNDGGATVSLNGGRTWSSQDNQPTAQFYRVNTDRQFPYFVYGGQQDNTSVGIASRTFGDGIDRSDWFDVGGCESAYAAFDRDNPRFVYAGCYQGIITEYDRRTRETRNIMAYPALGLGEPSNEQKYRFNWNAPIVVSSHDPKVIYHAGHVLLRSADRGLTWAAISPDLTRNEKDRQGQGGGPITNEGAGGEVYNTIFSVAESPHDARTIWTGADDGLVHVTRDAGATWSSVTPKEVGAAQINAIEVSPHEPGTAYLAVTRYKFNDYTPHIFKTTDFGKSWTRIVTGLPEHSWVRVVREDPVRKDLLFAGTETGIFASFDGGTRWQTLQLNLPVVPVTDLQIRDRDLVAATQGRAFWILDDIAPLRELSDQVAVADLHLFKPSPAPRVGGFPGSSPAAGKNPPNGAVISYSLKEAPKDAVEVTLEILDGAGTVIRTYSSKPESQKEGVPAPAGRPPPPPLAVKAGLNRAVWDFRGEPIATIEGLTPIGNMSAPRVGPGTYQARLRLGHAVGTQAFEVMADPRTPLSQADFRDQQRLALSLYQRTNEIHRQVAALRDAREQIRQLVDRTKDHARAKTIAEAGQSVISAITTLEERLVQPRHKTFQDVINYRNQLADHYRDLLAIVDGTDPPVTKGMQERAADLEKMWADRQKDLEKLLRQEIPAFNKMLGEQGIPSVIVKKP